MNSSPLNTTGSDLWAASLSDAIHAQRERMRDYLTAQQTRLEQAAEFIEQELRQLEKELQEQRERSERSQASNDALTARLAQTESQLAETRRSSTSAENCGTGALGEEAQRRLRTAMAELRQTKSRVTDSQESLDKDEPTASSAKQPSRVHVGLDWEAEKRRILAALEADADVDVEAVVDDPSARTERMTIVEVLRTTDEVIAAKDREIRDLKRQLDEKQRELVGKTSDEEWIEQAVSNDEVIRQERERLKQLQAEWREKLRQAEVELALERAKIARQRAELEESRPAEKSSDGSASTATAPHAETSHRGRWLARLGLTDADREPSRHPRSM